ncbi:amp dependent CoA ligase [Eremomyces bilateralis CBS 781.70]|uniref:Amp dependent CoA ligase n=1 Tax=Eremomyces bilateralis CBS 781.70 TaxID=1392243 RepID=A0A6G1GCS7_9PEZI|nr:amp dependent CoA ligase [Eremomyces bilateralis CBS 781.70]KAF1815701.1 amp dependent CoA ligase [Eremomyces bilateralis CBS 781.70]
MLRYNPDDVASDKLVHLDTISGKSLTYGGLRKRAAHCAWGLRNKLGLQVQQIMLVFAPNCTDFVLLAHAIWWSGAVLSPLNTASTVKDIEHVLNLVGPTHIAVAPPFVEKVIEAIRGSKLAGSRAPTLCTLLERHGDLPLFPEDVEGTSSAESLPPWDLDGMSSKEAVSSVCFSSGTTGLIKGVKLSHYSQIMNMIQLRVSMPTRIHSGMREVFFPPFGHIYGVAIIMLTGMWVGAFFCTMPSFDLPTYCALMQRHRATDMHIVPPVALLLTTSPIAQSHDLSSVRNIMVTAAPLKPALQTKLLTRFPDADIYQGYGMTETCPALTSQHHLTATNIGSVGKLVTMTEARLVDPSTGVDVRDGEEGEMWVKGPQVMMGYINDAAATRAAFSDDGWLRTGDILRRDGNGDYWVTDRLKEMVKYKGFQVAPSELEDLLLGHPDVVDAAVCGVYVEAEATEVPVAYVSLVEGKAGVVGEERRRVLEGIRGWLDGRVGGYKRLRGGVHHLQELPKTPSGKILRRELPAKVKAARMAKL